MSQRTPLDSLITEKALHLLQIRSNSVIIDMMAEDEDYNGVMKNVCCKVHPKLAERIDNICNLLDISKRSFLEAAFIEACETADRIMTAEGVDEYLEKLSIEQASAEGGAK
jgi:hypothetical protein